MRLFNYPGIDAVYTTMGIQPSRLVSRWRYTAACRSVSIVATTVLVGPSIPVEGPPPPHPAPRVRIASLGTPVARCCRLEVYCNAIQSGSPIATRLRSRITVAGDAKSMRAAYILQTVPSICDP